MIRALIIIAALAGICGAGGTEFAVPVATMRTPHGGIQPQAVTGIDGKLHLLYYRGGAGAGDLYYCRAESNSTSFSDPIRVNTQPRSAIAAGTIRGGQLALGRKGRVHVVWNGSGEALPKHADGGSPLLYARLNDSGTAFEPERNLMGSTALLDGGCTVAADSGGGVYVFWHAGDGKSKGEEARRLWAARSSDDGNTFSSETAASESSMGACPCCSVKAFADSKGRLYAMFRGATERVNRDMILRVSKDQGGSYSGGAFHPWKVPT